MAKVLIAEDDFMIAEMLEEAVSEAGYEVCPVASSASDVVALGEQHRPDLAIIDVRLAGADDGIKAAAELSKRLKLGILYATGNCDFIVDKPPAVGHACLNKPFTARDVARGLKVVEHIVRNGVPSPLAPLPRNLHLLRRPSLSIAPDS